MINEESMKHWADEFNEIQEAKDARIADLEKQLAERDAALARCVEALKGAAAKAESRLREAIREEQADRSSETS